MLGVREPATRPFFPMVPRAFRTPAIKNSVRSRRLSRRQDQRSLGYATQSAMYRGFDRFPRREHRCCIGSRGPRVIERGPPGTRRAPICGGRFIRGLRENTKCLPAPDGRTKAGPRARCPRAKNIFTRRRISAVAKRPCLRADRSSGRSLRAHCFGNGVIWPENTAPDTNRSAVRVRLPIERQMGRR